VGGPPSLWPNANDATLNHRFICFPKYIFQIFIPRKVASFLSDFNKSGKLTVTFDPKLSPKGAESMENADLDPQLLEGLCNFNKQAQTVFWRKFHHYLCAQVAIQGVKSEQDVEEIVEDIFLRVFGSVAKFREESRFSTWLHAVTRNTIIDYYKSSKNRAIPCDVPLSKGSIQDEWIPPNGNFKKGRSSIWSEDRPLCQVVAPDDDILAGAITRESLKKLYSAILRLNPVYRDVLICRLIMSYSPKETAGLLGRNEAVTRTLSSRAMAALRKTVKEDPYFSVHEQGGEKLERPV
jgi:RNA polymerase sigma-70 factor (ECF subfamily)